MVATFNKKYFKLEHFLPPKVTPDAVALQDNVRPVFGGSQVDSARQNLASSFVNGFVNAGFGQVVLTYSSEAEGSACRSITQSV